jgi:hypothetical protein
MKNKKTTLSEMQIIFSSHLPELNQVKKTNVRDRVKVFNYIITTILSIGFFAYVFKTILLIINQY